MRCLFVLILYRTFFSRGHEAHRSTNGVVNSLKKCRFLPYLPLNTKSKPSRKIKSEEKEGVG